MKQTVIDSTGIYIFVKMRMAKIFVPLWMQFRNAMD